MRNSIASQRGGRVRGEVEIKLVAIYSQCDSMIVR